MTVDTEHRRLCHALFDALEQGDIAGVDACYAPDMTMWFNVTGEDDQPRGEPRGRSTRGAGLHRRRTYNDRNINTFDDGFVVQYTMPRRRPQRHRGAAVGVPRGRGPRRQDRRSCSSTSTRGSSGPGEAEMTRDRVRDPRALQRVLRRVPGRPGRRARRDHDATTASSGTTSSAARRRATRTSRRYPDSYTGQRRRTYNDRIINTFDDGFVIQYTLNGVMHTGTRARCGSASSAGAATGRSRASTSTWTRRSSRRWMGGTT